MPRDPTDHGIEQIHEAQHHASPRRRYAGAAGAFLLWTIFSVGAWIKSDGEGLGGLVAMTLFGVGGLIYFTVAGMHESNEPPGTDE